MTLNEKSAVALPEREMKQKLLTNQKSPRLTAEKGRNSFPRSTMAMTWFKFATSSQNSPNRASSIPSERLEQESTCHLSLSTGINDVLTVGLSDRKWEFSLFSERFTTNPMKELLLGHFVVHAQTVDQRPKSSFKLHVHLHRAKDGVCQQFLLFF